MSEPEQTPAAAPVRWPYALLAYACTALALAGLALPGLPTTPFVLAAAWAARRGSPALDRWLRGHRHLGPLLHHWQTQRAVPRRAKWAAVLLLGLSWTGLALASDGLLVPGAAALPMAAVALFVVTRPTPSPPPSPTPSPADAPE